VFWCFGTSEKRKTTKGTAIENFTSYISNQKMQHKTGRLLFVEKNIDRVGN
jgi:hypothetical protein